MSPAEIPWQEPAWLEEAHDWIRVHVEPTAPIEQPHVCPWSTVLRVPTADGPVWFKATIPAVGHETALLGELWRWSEHVQRPLALDGGRGWLLLPDGGPTLRRTMNGWEEWLDDVLPRYVELQRATATHADELVALGVPDHRLAGLPARAEALRPGLGEPTATLCERLAAAGIPETLQHDDLHSNNVFVDDGRVVFFDWGDSCVSHPLFTLVVLLRGVTHTFGAVDERRFLAVWGSGLDDAWEHAQRLGMLCRALTWRRVVDELSSPWSDQYEEWAQGWLDDYADAL